MPDPWPLRHLVLRTPRLTLCPDDDAGLYELAALALRGVHPPEEMPFLTAWTDQPPDSEKLGYRTDGANIFARRGVAATEIRLVLEPSHFVRPDWTLQADGLDGCRQMLGVL